MQTFSCNDLNGAISQYTRSKLPWPLSKTSKVMTQLINFQQNLQPNTLSEVYSSIINTLYRNQDTFAGKERAFVSDYETVYHTNTKAALLRLYAVTLANINQRRQQERRRQQQEQQRQRLLEEQQRQRLLEEQQRQRLLEEQQRQRLLEEQQRQRLLEEQQRQAVSSIPPEGSFSDDIEYDIEYDAEDDSYELICPISLEKIIEAAKLDECGHVFEYDEILDWAENNEGHATCPLCRAPFTKENITVVELEQCIGVDNQASHQNNSEQGTQHDSYYSFFRPAVLIPTAIALASAVKLVMMYR